VRQVFGVGDQFPAEYLSRLMGSRTILDVTASGQLKGVSSRSLLNPDEVRRGSKDFSFTFIEQSFPAALDRVPYYRVEALSTLAEPNPYQPKNSV
jgi:type IV secretory pathway TraG/TraD family ATPase VirD4